MAAICPTVTAYDAHEYRAQIEQVAPFALQLHIDLMDGKFAPTVSPSVEQVWWPHTVRADIHIMYQQPEQYLDALIEYSPRLVIAHAEAEGNFIDFSKRLRAEQIMAGVALLKDTDPSVIETALEHIDHVLIFSGDLGHFGGKVDMKLLEKVQYLKSKKPDLEIGWDGGINADNAKQLVEGGVDVLNVGGFIQKSNDPKAAYDTLKSLIE